MGLNSLPDLELQQSKENILQNVILQLNNQSITN